MRLGFQGEEARVKDDDVAPFDRIVTHGNKWLDKFET